MLDKSICDCNKSVRDLLRDEGIIDYDDLEAGDRHKFKATLMGNTHVPSLKIACDVSCYRANGRGDARIWITKVRSFADAGDVLHFSVIRGDVYVGLNR